MFMYMFNNKIHSASYNVYTCSKEYIERYTTCTPKNSSNCNPYLLQLSLYLFNRHSGTLCIQENNRSKCTENKSVTWLLSP